MAIWHLVKDHSDSKRKPFATISWAILSKQHQRLIYMHHTTDRIVHTMVFVTTIVEHWLEQEIVQWVHLLIKLQYNTEQNVPQLMISIDVKHFTL